MTTALISIEDWTEDESTDTPLGFGAEGKQPVVTPDKSVSLTPRDFTLLSFLSRYRYAYRDQLAYLVDCSPAAMDARLRDLIRGGYISKQSIASGINLYTATRRGMLFCGQEFPEVTKATLSPYQVAHTTGLASIGAEFEREAGGRDLLGQTHVEGYEGEQVPLHRWKGGIWQNPEGKSFGEMTITERQIRQAQGVWKRDYTTPELREQQENILSNHDEQQELLAENEHMFIVYALGGKATEHVPDLVVARERGEQGQPQHIAIELELIAKPLHKWRSILRGFRDSGVMFQSVVYFTPKLSIANSLNQIAKQLDMTELLTVRKFIPRKPGNTFFG